MQVVYWVALLLAVLAGAGLGAAAVTLLTRARSMQLRLECSAAAETAVRSLEELRAARDEADTWRARQQSEEVNRVRAESVAIRIPTLEAELQEARGKVESLTASRAALQEQADRLFKSEAELATAREKLEVIGAERSALREQAERVPALEARILELSAEVVDLSTALSGLDSKLVEQQKAHEEKLAMLTVIRGEIEKDLKNITNDALRVNQESFLQLAGQVFEKHKEGATADLDARNKAIEQLVAPVRETLQACQTNLTELESARAQAYGALSTELKIVIETQNAVRTETSKLVNALRAAPKTRGRWGEHTLRNVLELSGLSAYCDFTTEESFKRDGAALRPDVLIRLPGGRSIVVDAKTSTAAYLDAVEALDDEPRNTRALLRLPNKLRKLAYSQLETNPRKAGRTFETALAIRILLYCTPRLANLVGLHLDRHFIRSRPGPDGTLHIVIPAEEVKNRRELEYEVPQPLVAMLEEHLQNFRPKLPGAETRWLFPRENNRHVPGKQLAEQLVQAIYRHAGIRMTAHMFRHFGTETYLEENPTGHEIMSRTLGHSSSNTVMKFYARRNMTRAARIFSTHILKLEGE